MAQQTQQGQQQLYGTVRPCDNFNAVDDAKALRGALKGAGTDEDVVIAIIGRTSNSQRQEIKSAYTQAFGRDLVDDIKSDLSGHFEDVVRGLLAKPREYDAYCLHKAVSGLGTKESVLIEILLTRSNDELKEIKAIYKSCYKKELVEAIKSDTSGHFRHFLVSLVNAARDEKPGVDFEMARVDAEALKTAGVKKWGTDEETFNCIMALRSFPQLCVTFEAYQALAGEDIVKSIQCEFSGDIEDALVSLVEVVRDRSAYFAKKLYKSMKGLGTNDHALIRIIVSRSEVDLGNIKQAFQAAYNCELGPFVKDDTSGDYGKMLLKIIH